MSKELFQISDDSAEANQESKAFMTDVNFYQSPQSPNKNSPNPKTTLKPRKSRNAAKIRNLLPRISKSMRQQRGRSGSKKQDLKGSMNKGSRHKKKKSITRELKAFVRDFNHEIRNSRSKKPLKEQNKAWGNSQKSKNTASKRGLKCVESFLARQEEKTRAGLKGVYNRRKRGQEAQVVEALRRIENQDTFKELLKLKEEELIRTKKEFNKGNFGLQKLNKQAAQLSVRAGRAQREMGATHDETFIKQAVANQKEVEEGLEEVRWATESLKFRHKNCVQDLLVLKKNTETLKGELRRWKKMEADLKRKKNNHVKQADHLKREIDCQRRKRGQGNGFFRGSHKLKNLFHHELEKFHGKVILDEILKNKHEEGRHWGYLGLRG